MKDNERLVAQLEVNMLAYEESMKRAGIMPRRRSFVQRIRGLFRRG